MRAHTANELRYKASLLAADGATVLATGVACGIEDLAGSRLEQAQLQAVETTHMIVMHAGDAALLPLRGYVNVENLLYIVDYSRDPRTPRANMWTEIYCHVERTGN